MKIVESTARMVDFHNVAQGEVFAWRDEYGVEHYFIKTDDIEDCYDMVWNAVCLTDGEREHFDDVTSVRAVNAELIIAP